MEIETVNALVSEFGSWMYGVAVVIFLFVNLDKVQSLLLILERPAESRLKLANEYLMSGVESCKKTKEMFLDFRDEYYFQYVFGIAASAEFRAALARAYQKIKGEIKVSHFIKAVTHMTLDNGSIAIRISRGALVEYYINRVLSVLFLLSALFLVVVGTFSKDLIHVFFALFFVLPLGLFMLVQAMPVICAKSIRKRLEDSSNQRD